MDVAFITSAYITNKIQLNLALKAIESANTFKICVINHVYEHNAYLALQKANDIVFKNDKNIQARAWNKGIKRAIKEGYDRFLVGSHDILLSNNYIDELQKIDAGVCAGVAINNLLGFKLYRSSEEEVEIQNHDQSFAAFMIDKETIEKVGWFDEQFTPNYFEDDDYLIRLKKAGIKTARTAKTHFYHYAQAVIKTDQKEAEKYSKYLIINRQKYIAKWGGIPGYEN